MNSKRRVDVRALVDDFYRDRTIQWFSHMREHLLLSAKIKHLVVGLDGKYIRTEYEDDYYKSEKELNILWEYYVQQYYSDLFVK